MKNVSNILSATPSSALAEERFITILEECRNLKPIRSSMSEEQPRSIGEPVGKRLAVYCRLRVGTRIDEVKANMLGWKTYSFEELRIVHHRLTGSADGVLRDRVKHGVACYVSGYHPLFVAASCFYRLSQQALCHRFCGDLLWISERLFYPHAARGRCTADQVFADAAAETSLRTRNNLEVTAVRSRKQRIDMCGICGKLNFEKGASVKPALIRAMMDTIRHRGPDDEGLHIASEVGLGFVRLSIIDLSTRPPAALE